MTVNSGRAPGRGARAERWGGVRCPMSRRQGPPMNSFYEHHKDSIRFHYRCFDRILLNGLIQPFQQPERVVGFFDTYRQLYPVSRDTLRGRATPRRRPISRALTPSWCSRNKCRNCRMLSSRFAGIPISSSTIDGPGVPQLLNRGEQTLRAVTGSGGRLHFGMVAEIKSERWPTSNRNPRPDCLGIRIKPICGGDTPIIIDYRADTIESNVVMRCEKLRPAGLPLLIDVPRFYYEDRAPGGPKACASTHKRSFL